MGSSISVPVSSISEAGEAEEKTAELQTPDGNPAGEFTYSLSFRAFGGKLEHATGGTKKSLHVGINYLNLPVGRGRLNGCHNDIETLHTLITEKYGFPSENAKILRMMMKTTCQQEKILKMQFLG